MNPASVPAPSSQRELPIHGELIDDATVRWFVPAHLVPGRGLVTRAPEPLGELLRSGTVQLECEPGAFVARLTPGESWSTWSEPVRAAIVQALTSAEPDPDGAAWQTARAVELGSVIAEVLEGEAGAFVRSHGGTAQLISVSGDDAVIEMGGTCGGCVLQEFTLQRRIAQAVREQYPALGELSVVASKSRFWDKVLGGN